MNDEWKIRVVTLSLSTSESMRYIANQSLNHGSDSFPMQDLISHYQSIEVSMGNDFNSHSLD